MSFTRSICSISLLFALCALFLLNCEEQPPSSESRTTVVSSEGKSTSLDEIGSSNSAGGGYSLCKLLPISAGVGVYTVASITSKIEFDESYSEADGQMRAKTYVHYVSGDEVVASAPREFVAKGNGGINVYGTLSLPPFSARVGETVIVFLPQATNEEGFVTALTEDLLIRDRGDGGYSNGSILGNSKLSLDEVKDKILQASTNVGNCPDETSGIGSSPSDREPEELPHEIELQPADE